MHRLRICFPPIRTWCSTAPDPFSVCRLINQGNLIGVLYLENNLAPRVFGPARIAVLKLLASQAAMSLENTRLYRDLAKREAKIRRLVDANIVGICIWDLDGTILEANDAFLRMVGYEREDLVSGRLRWTDLTPAQWLGRDRQEVCRRDCSVPGACNRLNGNSSARTAAAYPYWLVVRASKVTPRYWLRARPDGAQARRTGFEAK